MKINYTLFVVWICLYKMLLFELCLQFFRYMLGRFGSVDNASHSQRLRDVSYFIFGACRIRRPCTLFAGKVSTGLPRTL